MVMRNAAGLVMVLLAAGQQLCAQEEAVQPLWGGAYISTGVFVDHRWHLFQGDITPLTSGSRLLNDDLADHRFTTGQRIGGTAFSAAISLHPFQRADRRGPELRAGFLSANDLGVGARYDRTTTITYDTLVSTVTGERYPVDSVLTSSYDIEHRYRMFGLQASLLWRTKGRFSIYGGIGLGAGLFYDAVTQVRYSLSTTVSGPAVGPDQENGTMDEEAFQNGTGFWFQWHIPLGMDYRMHRTHELWSRVHLYYELAPQMIFAQRPDLRSTVGTGLWALFGVRVTV
jgi:opacity protein-like surface antigen